MFRCQSCGAQNKVRPGHLGSPICGRCKATLDVSGTPQDVKGTELVRAIGAATVPVLVDFWAPWCAPCRTASPILDQFAKSHPGILIALKLNTEQESESAGTYGIQGIPTFILFYKGHPVDRRSGAMPKDAFSAWVLDAMAKSVG